MSSLETAGYVMRSSYVGTAKPDPGRTGRPRRAAQHTVLASFSPLGSSRTRGEEVAQIHPRTATPVQASSMAQMVSAASPESGAPAARYHDAAEPMQRLSISGRLSEPKERAPPAAQREGSPLVARADTKGLLRERFAYSRPEEKPAPPPAAPTRATAPPAAPAPAVPELIQSLVERSVGEAVREMRNDIQNLHVDLIKQTLVQQVRARAAPRLTAQSMLRQILDGLPDALGRLADDYRAVREENERLREKLGQ